MTLIPKEAIDLILNSGVAESAARSEHPDLKGWFETLEDAEDDVEALVASLADFEHLDHVPATAERLIECDSGSRCGSAACAVCIRHTLIYLNQECKRLNSSITPPNKPAKVLLTGALDLKVSKHAHIALKAELAARYAVFLDQVGLHKIMWIKNANLLIKDGRVILARTA